MHMTKMVVNTPVIIPPVNDPPMAPAILGLVDLGSDSEVVLATQYLLNLSFMTLPSSSMDGLLVFSIHSCSISTTVVAVTSPLSSEYASIPLTLNN